MPKIATWLRQCDEHWFVPILRAYPHLILHNARSNSVDLSATDALLLTGGGDISAGHLRQPIADPAPIVDTDLARDEWEFIAVAQALASGKPILAICRGLQVLNVALGGTLHLDIPDHDSAETSNIQKLKHSAAAIHRFEAVNSSHHQALNRLAEGLEVEAWSATDDIIEQARLRTRPYVMGVQYHPERHPMYLALFAEFFERIRELPGMVARRW